MDSKIEELLEAVRRHIRSFEPGTLMGSELNVAHHLAEIDGEERWKDYLAVPDESLYEPDRDWEEIGHIIRFSNGIARMNNLVEIDCSTIQDAEKLHSCLEILVGKNG